MVGLLGLSVACDHSAADMAAGGCSRAATECVIPLHPRATCLTDLRDHAVRLMKRRGRHGLGGGCDGQRKRNSDEPNHCFLRIYPFVERRRPTATRGWTPQRVWCARAGREKTGTNRPHLRLDGGRLPTCDVAACISVVGSPTTDWSKLLTHLSFAVGLCDAGGLMQNHIQQ